MRPGQREVAGAADADVDAPPADEPAGWSHRTFAVSVAILSVLLTLWSLATPRIASPDEDHHLIKAAAVVRGQLLGAGDPAEPGGPTVVRVPAGIASAHDEPCFAFREDVLPTCAAPDVSSAGPDVPVGTQAGRYPPAYYALVGLPTLVWGGLDVVYLVRGMSAGLVALLLGAALTAAAGTGRRLFPLALGFAVTPMVLFLGAAVNPNSLEIAAAVGFWTTGAVLVTSRGAPDRAVLVAAGLSGTALVLARPISPFWLGVAGLFLLALGGPSRALELLRSRAVQAWLAVLAVAAAAQVAWVLRSGALELYGTGLDLTADETLERSWDLYDRRLIEMVGLFGWLDSPVPDAGLWAWGTLGVLLLLTCLLRPRWWRLVLVLLAVGASVGVPIWLEVRSVADVGFFWQGRYTLPLAVGAPVLAALVLRRPLRPWAPLTALVLATVAAVHVLGYVDALARYTVGDGEGLGLLEQTWQPPVPVLVLVPAFALAAAAWAFWLGRVPVSRPARPEEPADEPATEPDPQDATQRA